MSRELTQILYGFRHMSGDKWGVHLAQFPPIVRQRYVPCTHISLEERYGL